MKKNAYSVSVHAGAKRTKDDRFDSPVHYFKALNSGFLPVLPQRRASLASRKAVFALFWRASLKLASSLHSIPAADYRSDTASYWSHLCR